jgi:MFS family permease
MLMPVLPVYITELNGSALEASLVISLTSLSALIFRSVSGFALDTFGRRIVLSIGVAILILCNIPLFWLPFVGLVLLLRLIQGIGWGTTSTSVATVVADVVPSARRGEGTGYYAVSVVLGSSLAPILAIPLMNKYGFSLILLITTIFFVLGLLFCQLLTYQQVDRQHSVRESGTLWQNLFEKRALLPAFFCLLIAFPFGAVMSFMMLYGGELNLDSVWAFFIGHCLMVLISRPFMGRLFDRKGHFYAIFPGAVSMIIGLVLLANSTSLLPLIAASLFYGFGHGSVQPSLQAWAVNRSPAHRRGAANGTFLSAMDVGVAFGSVILGLVADLTNYATMYLCAALFPLLLLVIYTSYVALERKNRSGKMTNRAV